MIWLVSTHAERRTFVSLLALLLLGLVVDAVENPSIAAYLSVLMASGTLLLIHLSVWLGQWVERGANQVRCVTRAYGRCEVDGARRMVERVSGVLSQEEADEWLVQQRETWDQFEHATQSAWLVKRRDVMGVSFVRRYSGGFVEVSFNVPTAPKAERPAGRVMALLEAVFYPRYYKLVFEPVYADFWLEYVWARRAGRTWYARWVYARFYAHIVYLAVFRFAAHVAGEIVRSFRVSS